MSANEPTVANVDLWSKYFQDEWGRWLNPLGVQTPAPEVAEGTAARVAGFLALVAAGPIAWLYSSNTPNVTPIRAEAPAALRRADEMESIEEPAA